MESTRGGMKHLKMHDVTVGIETGIEIKMKPGTG